MIMNDEQKLLTIKIALIFRDARKEAGDKPQPQEETRMLNRLYEIAIGTKK